MSDQPSASATLLLLRDEPLEVLMVRRGARGAFPSSLVFPGGAIEPGDHEVAWEPLLEDFAEFEPEERARRIGAIRETWEETSILVGLSAGSAQPAGILTGLSFRDFVEQSGIRLRLGALTNFGHWITPRSERRRFDTAFYLAAAPDTQVAVADGSEIVGVEWVEPALAAASARRGEWPIIFPTLMNLDRLAESTAAEHAFATAAARAPFTVQPVIETDESGRTVIVIPAEAGYSVTRFFP